MAGAFVPRRRPGEAGRAAVPETSVVAPLIPSFVGTKDYIDRVGETSTSTGLGSFTLNGAISGARTFASTLTRTTTQNFDYTIEGVDVPGEWEVGRGTWNGASLLRSLVVASSNGNNPVNFSAGTKNCYLVIAALVPQKLANYIYIKADYGAVGDGISDDTAQINKAVNEIDADRGQILVFEPGRYLVPGGITEHKDGLQVLGLGHLGYGPSNEFALMGVQIYSTNVGVWTWRHDSSVSSSINNNYNDFKGARFENICFVGNANTAGGLLVSTNHVHVRNCGAVAHTTGSGFKTDFTVQGDTSAFNQFISCTTQDCLHGYDLDAGYTTLMDCTAVKYSIGGIAHTGTGVIVKTAPNKIIGGHFESHDIGINCIQELGISIVGPILEDNTSWDIALNRASGTTSTRNTVIATTSQILVGPFQVGDVVIGGDYHTMTDQGTQTMLFGKEILKLASDISAGAPTGGLGTGQIMVKDYTLWFCGYANNWYGVQVMSSWGAGAPSGGFVGQVNVGTAKRLYFKDGDGTWCTLTGV